MKGRLGVILLAVGAVAIAAIVSTSGGGGHSGSGTSSNGGTGQKAPKGALSVSFLYSPEKEPLLVPLIRKFNDQHNVISGHQVFIDAKTASSGDVEDKTAK